jgi:hypothetical protein
MARGDARAATDRATDRPRIAETAPSSPACIGPSPSSRCCAYLFMALLLVHVAGIVRHQIRHGDAIAPMRPRRQSPAN